jgi:3-phosphoinositide dependent protein kinase-1
MSAEMFSDFQNNAEFDRKGTFVGTVNFIAPEMIKECQSTCASDLWALGCIIFKMSTG